MLKEKYSDIEIVHYADLPMKWMPEKEVVDAIAAVNPDGVVVGFGG
jgi:UDP-N-acetyl-D-mannosaminuronic acid transferase (WecB/TagA/CpsF family)